MLTVKLWFLGVEIYLGLCLAHYSADAILVGTSNVERDEIEWVSSERCPNTFCRAPPINTSWSCACEPDDEEREIQEDEHNERECCVRWRCVRGFTTKTIYGIKQSTMSEGPNHQSLHSTFFPRFPSHQSDNPSIIIHESPPPSVVIHVNASARGTSTPLSVMGMIVFTISFSAHGIRFFI